MKRYVSFSFLFLALALLDLSFVWWAPDWRYATKPLIIIALIIHFYSNITSWTLVKRLFFIGLFFALLGDVFLMFDGSRYFVLGLGSFLVMQLLFATSFLRDAFIINWKRLLFGVGLVVILFCFLHTLQPGLGDMLIPVVIYSICISTMTFLASTRRVGSPGYVVVLIGALLFMISDGFIAWTRFLEPLTYGGLIIMSTYILAQYLICTGFLSHLEDHYA